MLKGRFKLNSMYMSTLHIVGLGSFPAWSGQKMGRNAPDKTHWPDTGPLLRGRYYVVERPSGGRLAPVREAFLKHIYGTDRSTCFALYRDDGKIDDITFTQGVKRGNFRPHPIGPQGISEGCITLSNPRDFDRIRQRLLQATTIAIPGSKLRAYSVITVE